KLQSSKSNAGNDCLTVSLLAPYLGKDKVLKPLYRRLNQSHPLFTQRALPLQRPWLQSQTRLLPGLTQSWRHGEVTWVFPRLWFVISPSRKDIAPYPESVAVLPKLFRLSVLLGAKGDTVDIVRNRNHALAFYNLNLGEKFRRQ